MKDEQFQHGKPPYCPFLLANVNVCGEGDASCRKSWCACYDSDHGKCAFLEMARKP